MLPWWHDLPSHKMRCNICLFPSSSSRISQTPWRMKDAFSMHAFSFQGGATTQPFLALNEDYLTNINSPARDENSHSTIIIVQDGGWISNDMQYIPQSNIIQSWKLVLYVLMDCHSRSLTDIVHISCVNILHEHSLCIQEVAGNVIQPKFDVEPTIDTLPALLHVSRWHTTWSSA